jgi:hypothetical protein
MILLIAANFPPLALAQENKITIGETTTVHSSVLQEERRVMIYLPGGYAQSKTAYPVVYLLDGDAHFLHVSGIVQFLSQVGKAPQMILVGILNTDRTRDLTPPTADDTAHAFPTSGGARNFLKFISEELVPYIDSHYRTTKYKILIGHSFGGLFAVHTLLTQPGAFDALISISPSLWWNNNEELTSARKFFKSDGQLRKFFYMTMGEEGERMVGPAQTFAKTLETNAPKDFRWKFSLMSKENHGTIPHRSIYDGLELLFEHYPYPADSAAAGIAALRRHFEKLSQELGSRFEPPEVQVNTIGYQLLGQKKIAEAISMFRYNVEKYPESANVYDSLGDGYEANMQLELAEACCLKACEIGKELSDPNLSVFRKHLETVQKKLEKK